MILDNTKQQEIIIGDVGKSMEFEIDQSSSVIFDILRDKMYSNKIGSICREVASNSRDANREAGVADTPIEIEFTNENAVFNIGDTCIIFRDSGIGITPHRMENIFMKYAASTKRTTNSQTGGFGLGAKTPFAYTDSFVIVTVCDVDGERMEYTYNAIIDGNAKNKMIELDSRKVDKPTGTEIIIPITSHEDRAEFEKECYIYTSLWEHVNYVNFHKQKPTHTWIQEEDNFKVLGSSSDVFGQFTNYIAMVDGIPYPVQPRSHRDGLGSNTCIVFELDIEEVSISSSREALQVDERTLGSLDKKIEEVIAHFSPKLVAYLTEHDSYMDALQKYVKISKDTYYKDGSDGEQELLMIRKIKHSYGAHILSDIGSEVLYNGMVVDGKLRLNAHRVHNVSIKEIIKSDKGVVEKCTFDYSEVKSLGSNTLDSAFYYMDTGRKSVAKNLYLYNSNKGLLYITPAKDAPQDRVDADLFLLEEMGIEFDNYSEVEIPKGKVDYQKGVSTLQMRIRTRRNYHRTTIYKLDKSTKKLYDRNGVEVDKEKVFVIPIGTISDTRYMHHDNQKDSMVALIKLQTGFEDYFYINENSYKRHLEKQGYQTLNEVFKKVDLSILPYVKEHKKIKSILNDSVFKFFNEHLKEVVPKSTKFLEEKLEKLEKTPNLAAYKEIRTHYFNKGEESKFEYDTFIRKWLDKTTQKYPMLLSYFHSLSLYRLESVELNRVIREMKEYIKSK